MASTNTLGGESAMHINSWLGNIEHHKTSWITSIAIATSLSGCLATSQVFEMGRDTYSVTATADGFRSAADARESVFQAGMEKCKSLGKRFMIANESIARTRMAIDTTVTVTFRCLNESDPEYARPNVRKTPDVVIEDQRKP